MSAHTPGPWCRNWIYSAIRHINKNVDEDGFCECTDDLDHPNVRNTPGDAALLAAAPDLLNALRGMIALNEARDDAAGWSAQRIVDTVRAAHTAIAKAEGRLKEGAVK